jgi:hypothetical protein
VGAETLQIELLGVPGVSAAEIATGDGAIPTGVKVSLSADADARRVGIEVQRILAAHGMRSRFSSDKEEDSPLPPSVDDSSPTPPVPEVSPPVAAPPTVSPPVAVVVEPVPEPPPNAPPAPAVELRSVSVEERMDGLTASVVMSDGGAASRVIAAGLGTEELDAAVVGAVAEAAGESVTARAIEWLEIDERTVVTVVVERGDGSLGAGAGVTKIGRAFVVGTATSAALQS